VLTERGSPHKRSVLPQKQTPERKSAG